MIKTYFFLSSSKQDPFAFTAETAREHFARLCPQGVGYVQTRTLEEQVESDDSPPYAGVAELWFTDASHALSLAAQPQALSPLWREGEVTVSAVVTGHERIVMRRPEHHEGHFIKGVFPFRRKKTLDVREFQRTWWHDHGPIAARTEGAVMYVQCHPLGACYDGGAPPYDGVTELYWRDVATAREAMASRQMREDQARDAERFVEPGSVLLFLAQEEIVVPP